MASDDCISVDIPQQTAISFYRRHWLLFHMLGYVVIAVSSLGMLLQFSFLRTKFLGNCPLYAVPVVVKTSKNLYSFVMDGEQRNNAEATEWGSLKTCDFVFTISALSFISAFIWCWFFCLCNAGSEWNGPDFVSKDQKWRVVPPATVFALVMLILSLVNSSILSAGMGGFCSALEDTVVKSCTEASDSGWIFMNLTGFYSDASWSIAEAWVTFGGWLMQTVMLFVHCLEGPGTNFSKMY